MGVHAGVKKLVLPALTVLKQGQGFLSRVRQIDQEDLLGLEPVKIDMPHVEALQQTAPRMQFETVGFGNVLGSVGSVIPRFQ
jgi:FlaA1/EpsC-like NDP-sugar epimerase